MYFLLRLIPPRPSFAVDMTDAERALMREHVVYWTALVEKGDALLFGPVADPKGGWGVGIVDVESDDAARALSAADPVMRAGLGFAVEIHPMPAVVRKQQPRGAEAVRPNRT